MYFFYKNLIVLQHGDNNFDIFIKFTLSTISQRWRNDNISLDVYNSNGKIFGKTRYIKTLKTIP